MAQHDKDSKLILGLIIGGAVGIGALTLLWATRQEKPPFDSLGKTLLRVGEILDEHDIAEPAPLKRAEKKLHRHETSIGQVVDWVATGIQLWKKFKS